MKRLVLLCAVLVCSGFGPGVRAQTLDEVLARHYEAMGGLEKTKAVQAVKMTGTALVPSNNVELEMAVYQARPNRYLVAQQFQGTRLAQSYDGKAAWVVNPLDGASDQPVKVPPAEAEAIAEMSDFDGPLYDAAAKGHTLVLAGQEDVEGRKAHRIEVTLQSGSTQTLYLDAEHYVTLRRVAKTEQNGTEAEVVQRFDDYRLVDGILVPHLLETMMNGEVISRVTIESVELNPTLDETFFSMGIVEEK